MKYFVLLAGYGEVAPWDASSPEEQEAQLARLQAFSEACATRVGVEVLAEEALSDGSMATTLRTRGGEMTITDGPFAEAAEQIRALAPRNPRPPLRSGWYLRTSCE